MTSRTAENIYKLLVDDIVSGEFLPGKILAEVALATRYNVSRTPVREALHRLEQANLAERGARRAFFVREMQAGDLEELFEAVGEVEAALAALAAQRMSEIQRRQLVGLVDEGEACGDDAKRYGEVNTRFHALIGQGAHNTILMETHADLILRTQVWRVANFQRDARRLSTSRSEHRDITDAILNSDANATRKRMREHVASSFVTLTDILSRDR